MTNVYKISDDWPENITPGLYIVQVTDVREEGDDLVSELIFRGTVTGRTIVVNPPMRQELHHLDRLIKRDSDSNELGNDVRARRSRDSNISVDKDLDEPGSNQTSSDQQND